MRRAGALIAAAVLLAAWPAGADKTKVKVTVEVEVEVEEITALTEVPETIETAADAGSTETELKTAYGAMKNAKVMGKPAKAIGMHFKTQAEEGMSDEGLGDIVRECIEKGHDGEDLVKCVTGEWDKKPKKDRPKTTKLAKAKGDEPVEAVSPPKVVAPAKGGKEHEVKETEAAKGKAKKTGATKFH